MNSTRKIIQIAAASIAVLAMLFSSARFEPVYASEQRTHRPGGTNRSGASPSSAAPETSIKNQAEAANPHFSVRAGSDEIEAYEWSLGDTLDIEIDDPGTGQNPDYTTSADVSAAPWDPEQTYAYIPVWSEFDVEPGHVISMSNGVTTKTHTVTDLGVLDPGIDTDVVTGAATPNSRVDVWACDDIDPCVYRHVDTDGSGNWSADFGNPGDEDDEQEIFDVTYGAWIDSSDTDADGDFTLFGMNIPNTRLEAILNENAIEGHEWPEDALVTLTIDDPNTPGPIDYTDSQTATYPTPESQHTYMRFELTSFTLGVGHTVTLTDGDITKLLLVANVQVTGWDYAADTLTGTAPSDAEVWVDLWDEEASPRHVQSDAGGSWTADYGAVGDEDFENFTRDIVNGSTGDASVRDADNDSTHYVFDTYSIWVAPNSVPLVAALTSDIDLDRPSYRLDDWTVLNLLYEPLFRSGNGGALVPAGATGYTVSPDGLEYTITLRANKWSDAKPVTAKHYVDGFLRILEPETATDYALLLFDIQGAQDYHNGSSVNPNSVGIKALNSTTLEITLAHTSVYFPKLLTLPGFFPVRMDRINFYDKRWTKPAYFAANGPYKMLQHDAGHFLLVKNPNYYNAAKVSFAQLGLAIYRDPNEPFEAYKRGEVDAVSAPAETFNDPLYRFERVVSDSPGVFYIGLNVQRGPTNMVLVRRALAAATDRRALLDDVLETPWRQEATGVIPPELPEYQGIEAGFPYNPTLAQDLLTQAGFPGGAGLATIHLYGSDAPSHQVILDAVAEQWENVLGVTVEAHYRSDYNEWISGCESNPGACAYNGFRQGWYVDYFDTHNILNDLFHPDNSFSKRMGWDNTQYRNLIDQSRAEEVPAERTLLLQQAENILVEQDAAVIPLYFFDRIDLVKPGYKTAYGSVPYYEQWSFKPVAAPVKFNKISPLNNALKLPTNPTLSWAASTGAAEYEYCIDTTNNNSCDGNWVRTLSTKVNLSGLTNDTAYYWQVRAHNALGTVNANAGAWWTFKVIISAPSLVSPNDGDPILTARPTFDWNDVTEAGVTGYTIQISTSSTFATISHSATTIASTYTPAVDLPKGKIYWRVQSKGTNGPSAWSAVRWYQGPYPPAAPLLSLPANTALTKDYTPLFKWSVPVIPAGAPSFDKYQLQVALDPAFSSLVLEQDLSGLSSNQFTPTVEFASNTKYYWRVRGVDTLPENGAWSAVRNFRTVLTPPALVSPIDGFASKELRPLFDWDAPGGPGAISGYTIQISKNSTFTQVIHTGNPTASSYTPTVDLPKNSTLHWRVLAKGANGPSLYSSSRMLTTPVNPPPTVVLLSPVNNILLKTYTNPVLKWKPVTFPDVSFQHYQVQVANNLAFSNPMLDDVSIISRLITQLTTSLTLIPNTKYYWRVRAVSTTNELGNWSAVWTIRAAILPPTLSLPLDGATGVSRKPTLDWEDVPGNTGYVLQVWKAGPTPVLVKSVTLPPNVSQYIFVTPLLPNTDYFWKVQTKGSNGPSVWSATFDFETGP